MVADKNIKVSKNTKKRLDKLKLHSRETYDDLIMRIIEAFQWNGKEYIYKFSTTKFKTCREFKQYLNIKYPLMEFKCNFKAA